MKIIERGLDPTPPTWRMRCRGCKTLFEYTRDDIQGDRGGDHVRCPNCNAYIDHSLGQRTDPIGRAEANLAHDYYNK